MHQLFVCLLVTLAWKRFFTKIASKFSIFLVDSQMCIWISLGWKKDFIQGIIIRVSALSIMNKKIEQSGIVVIWMDVDDPSVVENLWYVRQNYSTKEWYICENPGLSLHTSPTVVVQLRLICSSPSCGSSRILATKAVTIERPASLRANLEKMAMHEKGEEGKKKSPLTQTDRNPGLELTPPPSSGPSYPWSGVE